ncbi:S8 family serine peptidase [Primorskyibacter sp. S87]|uniref:S8 family serine peptidase n=1 Tax=Primorskyibacter sp. S87 TaxID=3415126 RepID=UPI003C7D1F6D
MSFKMFLFDQSQARLRANLETVDLTVTDFSPDPSIGIPPLVNPWTPVDQNGNALPMPPNAGGYGYEFIYDTRAQARIFLDKFRQHLIDEGTPELERIYGVGLTALPFTAAHRNQHWCAGRGRGVRFGTRRMARQVIGADSLDSESLTGNKVKVFIVDQGINKIHLESMGGTFGGGLDWEVDGVFRKAGQADWPYTPARREHTAMLLRSVLDLAPNAEIYDLPVLPARITDIKTFTTDTLFAFWIMKWMMEFIEGPWVVLSAWGLVNRFAETLHGEYSNNPLHQLNYLHGLIGQSHDVIFAAGNSGQFCADPRASGYDRGPGRSIFGANGHPKVTSVGAVRPDRVWIGASSQGPGPAGLNPGGDPPEKPDFCTPSWFAEDVDRSLRSTGTSAAAGLAAGAVAALREKWKPATVDPAALRATLRNTARKVDGSNWNGRTGAGVLDLGAAISELP